MSPKRPSARRAVQNRGLDTTEIGKGLNVAFQKRFQLPCNEPRPIVGACVLRHSLRQHYVRQRLDKIVIIQLSRDAQYRALASVLVDQRQHPQRTWQPVPATTGIQASTVPRGYMAPPSRISQAHPLDQINDFAQYRMSAQRIATLPLPVQPESLSVPGDHGFGLNHHQCRLPAALQS